MFNEYIRENGKRVCMKFIKEFDCFINYCKAYFLNIL